MDTSITSKPQPDTTELLRAWEKFYLTVFEREVDFSGLVVPAHQAGFDRLIVVAGGLTPNVAFRACQDRFPTRLYYNADKAVVKNDLDKAVVKNDREPTQAYAIWVRDGMEADEEWRNHSANQLQEKGIPGIILLERLLLELKVHEETGDHLDKMAATRCDGSRYSDGDVPGVGWDDGYLNVGGFRPDIRHDGLRSRQAVS